MRERVIYYSEDDLTIGLNLGPAVEVLNVFTPDKDYNLEDLVELFHVNQIITKANKPNDWTKEMISTYSSRAELLKPTICSQLSAYPTNKLIDDYRELSSVYKRSFWKIIDLYGLKMLNENIVRTLIDQDIINLRYLLEVKKFAVKYNKIAAEQLRSHSKEAVEWILSEKAEIHDSTYHHVYIPTSFTDNDKEAAVKSYLMSERPNLNYVNLLLDSKAITLSPPTKLLAKEVQKRLNKDVLEEGVVVRTNWTFRISSADNIPPKAFKVIDGEPYLIYSHNYISSLPSEIVVPELMLLLGFIDEYGMIELINKKPSHIDIMDLAGIKSKDAYNFYSDSALMNRLAVGQMAMFYKELKNEDRPLEHCLEIYYNKLNSDFGYNSGKIDFPTEGTSFEEKVRTLASEVEAIMRRFQAFVKYGFVNDELADAMDSMKIEEVGSLVKYKYVYQNFEADSTLLTIQRLLFSDQTMLDYVGKYKDKRLGNLYHLLRSGVNVRKADYKLYHQEQVKYLLDEHILYENDDGFLHFVDSDLASFLYELYTKGSCFFWGYTRSVKEWIMQKTKEGELEISSSLLSRPEQDWLSYYWDNSKFSNSLAIRNRYAHGRKYGANAQYDYITVLMIISILVVKIYSDLAIAKMLKDAGKEEEVNMKRG